LFLLCTHDARPENAVVVTEPTFAARRIFVDGIPVVRLSDFKRGMEVSVLPTLGNLVYEMKINGTNILAFPDVKLSDFQKNPVPKGIPFMAPWLNRLDGNGFWANGKKYGFNLSLGNLVIEKGLPIHGLIRSSMPWQVMDIGADQQSAHWKYEPPFPI